MEYLTRWRMLLAGDRLKNSRESISAIASSLGYESESAFGKAFKRVMACSPREYGREIALPSATSVNINVNGADQYARSDGISASLS